MVSTLTSPGDDRNSRSRPIGASDKLELTTIISENTKTIEIPHSSGQVVGLEYLCPDLTTDTTFTISFLTNNDLVIHTTAALDDNKTTGFFVNAITDTIYLPPNSKIKVTFTTAQVATFEVILHMK